ncbi:MAG: hypothetical protein PHI84_12350 [Kiritimatiellae bacterium]|nr:hypothetical protein [Kiritimatiellia bacterium]
MSDNIRLKAESIHTYAYLYHAAKWVSEVPDKRENPLRYSSMLSILASAFSLEAYMNHLGPRYFPKWDKDGLRSPNEKIDALMEKLKVDKVKHRSQFDSYMLALRIRESLVHGRTHEVHKKATYVFNPGSKIGSTQPEWKRKSTKRDALMILNGVADLMHTLSKAAGDEPWPYHTFGKGIEDK